MFGASRARRYIAGIALAAVALLAAEVRAAGLKGAGSAKVSEWKSPPQRSTLRARALRRARLAALQAAIDGIDGPMDDAAKKTVLSDGTRWTGAYRILSERVDPEGIHIELDVDIDVARLAKYVAPTDAVPANKVRWHVDAVVGERGCDLEPDQVAADLERLGVARAKIGKSQAVSVTLTCDALGPVPNTLLQAVRLRVEAKGAGSTILSADEAAFGVDERSARERGAGAVAERIATLLLEDPGGVVVRIESPHPADRVRRLQRAMTDQLQGVRDVELIGIDPDGSVRVRVRGRASVEAIAQGLRALSMPDFSITIVGVHDARGLTVRLR